jgi:hypothetical protein
MWNQVLDWVGMVDRSAWLPIVLGAGFIHCTIGAIAAAIAQRKGRKLSVWLPLGLIVGTPALVVALLLSDSESM